MARNHEFNRDMESYLRNRKVVRRTNPFLAAKSYFMNMFKPANNPQQRQEVMPNDQGDLTPEQVQAVMATGAVKPLGKVVGRHAPAKPAAQVQQAPKKVKSMGWFSRSKEEDYEEVAPAMQQPVLDEDVREVLKITFKWLKQMDPEQIDEIKRSPDFEKYKQVLDKYGLIKK